MKKLILILLCLPMIGFGQAVRIIFYDKELREVKLEESKLVYNYLEIHEQTGGVTKAKLFYADRLNNRIAFDNINERAGEIRGEGTLLNFNQSDFNRSIFKEWTKYDIEGKIMHKSYNISYDEENQTEERKWDSFTNGKLSETTTSEYEILPDGEKKELSSLRKTFDKEYNFEYYSVEGVLHLPYTRFDLKDNSKTALWHYDFTEDREYQKRALEIKSKEFEINDEGLELYNSNVTLFLENFSKTLEVHREFNLVTNFSHPDLRTSTPASLKLTIGDYDHKYSINCKVGLLQSEMSVNFTERIRGMNIKNETFSIDYDDNQLKLYTNRNRITINLIKDKIYFAVNETVVASSDYFGDFSEVDLSSYSKTPVIVESVTARVDGYSNIKLNNNKTEWIGNGSGFFISTSGYIVTNHHVVDEASEIEVEFKYRNEIKGFNAKVIQTDAINDLAILKIDDDDFSNVGALPYTFRTRSVDVGTDVFALGYPKALTIMGKEIKFTDGRISSKTGFKGDITTYQSTTPIQPGNSGGPLFDFKGNLIGINNAKIITEDVEGVSYSIKSSYLLNLIDVLPETIPLPSSTQLASKPLTEQIKILSDYVVLIKVK